MDLNRGWFVPNLLFERVVIAWSIGDGSGSGSGYDDNDGSEDSKVVSGAEEE